ncbi:MAG: 50S ribosomal protein L32 [Patescibacteria group bacterium]
MALPTQKRTKSSKRVRAFTHALKKQKLTNCAQCKKAILPHHACLNCGYYKNQDVLKIKIDTKKSNNKKEVIKNKK